MEGFSSIPTNFLVLFLGFFLLQAAQCEVTYDRKSLIINGQRKILISGSIHYPRSTPDMWEGLAQKAKDGGLDVIQTYVFWNGHEPTPGNYNFQGRYDLVRFIKTIQKAGMYVHLRIGPYICGEWNFGGFPVWLKYVPGISFRTDNEPFKMAMQGFTQKIVEMMKSEELFASQGGPIILSQIENEYGPESKEFGPAGQSYVNWAAQMAIGLGTGVPWVMCKEDDAPDPVINTCNGFYCDTFTPNKPNKPTMWTEAWSGWFTEFGGTIKQRPVEDLAFAVARFIQKGGSFVNYYMYHGGTNFGRTAGGPFITTSYDYDAPIDEYGIAREPKYGHLKELHRSIKLCEQALVSADPTVTSLGSMQEAHVFQPQSGGCAAFLANYNTKSFARVMFNNRNYNLPPWSISILPDCTNVVFNTAKVGVQTTQMQMWGTNTPNLLWERYDEEVSSFAAAPLLTSTGLLEQINVTRDSSDYLWYITDVDVSPSEKFLQGGHATAGAIQVRSDAVANSSNAIERADTTTEANNTGAVAPFKETLDLSDPPNEEKCNISEVRNNATREESLVNNKDNCFKLNTKDVLNHSESSAFSRYGERRKQILNDNPSSSSLHFRNGKSFNGDLQTSTSLPPKEDGINHQSVTPPLGFIPVHFPVGSVPYGYTTILHPIYYPSYPLPDNTTAQTTGDDINHSKCKTAEDGPNLEEDDFREPHTVIQRGSCSQDVAIASHSGETGNGNISGNGNLESGNESAAHTGDRSRREAALIKFRLKRKDRCFEKKVRYYNRKKLADQRPRVKGQFVSQKATNSAPQTETES